MKNIVTSIMALGILLALCLACEFSTASLAEITFSDDDKGKTTFTTARQGDKIYAISKKKFANGRHLIRWKVTNSKGEQIKLPENEAVIEGTRSIWLTLTLRPQVFPEGKYNFEVRLLSENGEKEFDSKTSVLEVKN